MLRFLLHHHLIPPRRQGIANRDPFRPGLALHSMYPGNTKDLFCVFETVKHLAWPWGLLSCSG